MPPLDEQAVLEFMRLLWGLDHALQKRSKWMASMTGVTGPQRLALRLIGFEPAISAGRLASGLCVHPSTLTGVLRRLESKGLVRRRAVPGDRRRTILALTRPGRAAAGLSTHSVEHAVTQALARARAGSVRVTSELLRSLTSALERRG